MTRPATDPDATLDDEILAQGSAAAMHGRPTEFSAMQIAYLEEAVRERDRRIEDLERRLAETEQAFETYRQSHRPEG